MKQKISITIEEGILQKLDDAMNSGRFRNKSHLVEFAVKKLLEEENGR